MLYILIHLPTYDLNRFEDWKSEKSSNGGSPRRFKTALGSVSNMFRKSIEHGSGGIKSLKRSIESRSLNKLLSNGLGSGRKTLNPQGKFLQKWNKIFVLSCVIAVSVDPLFFYIPIVKDFCTSFIAPSSRVFGKGVLVEDAWEIAKRYMSSYFLVDILAVLPLLPQVPKPVSLETYQEWSERNKKKTEGDSKSKSNRGGFGGSRGRGRGRAECTNLRHERSHGNNLIREQDDNEPALLLASFDNGGEVGASNHMTGDKDKLCDLNEIVQGSVKFRNESKVRIEGKGSIVFQCKNGEYQKVDEVYYIPDLCSNIISLGQLAEGGDEIKIKDHQVKKSFKMLLREEEDRLQNALTGAGGSSPSLGATIYASRFAANALHALRRNSARKAKISEKLPPLMLQKSSELDFTAEDK
ncbi:hypothetical protein Tco_1044515 [Tanacetum coccineum]|uniref:Retrovirus-related Pol polyprotein from transposon TNT 1-94-like beta-barrel domain-containing protein n=1 Tax=Tanacetum coccineum TaxID=301880 RepID=A0ABQ5GR95_9ASTR